MRTIQLTLAILIGFSSFAFAGDGTWPLRLGDGTWPLRFDGDANRTAPAHDLGRADMVLTSINKTALAGRAAGAVQCKSPDAAIEKYKAAGTITVFAKTYTIKAICLVNNEDARDGKNDVEFIATIREGNVVKETSFNGKLRSDNLNRVHGRLNVAVASRILERYTVKVDIRQPLPQ